MKTPKRMASLDILATKPPTETWWKASPYVGAKLMPVEVVSVTATSLKTVREVGSLGWMYRQLRIKTTEYSCFPNRVDAENYLISMHKDRIAGLRRIIAIEQSMIDAIKDGRA